jgi:hypothetical protein
MSTSSIVPISTCAAREQLAREFRVLLDSYNDTLLTLMDAVGLEAASRQMDEQYQRCIDAREAIRAHEREHHCSAQSSADGSPASEIE